MKPLKKIHDLVSSEKIAFITGYAFQTIWQCTECKTRVNVIEYTPVKNQALLDCYICGQKQKKIGE